MKIFDFHNHVFPDAIAEKATRFVGEYYDLPMTHIGTVEVLINSLNAAGITAALIHSTATKESQVQSVNRYLAGVIQKHKNLVAFGTIHPLMSEEDIHKELTEIKAMGLRGLKLHADFTGYAIDDPLMLKLYSIVEGVFPVLMHVGDPKTEFSKPAQVRRVIDMFPKLTVIAAHLGGYSAWDEAMEYLVGRNLYLDTSSALWAISPERAQNLILAHGTDKILFGTDFPITDHGEELARFMNLSLSDKQREDILYNNAKNLLILGG